MKKVALMRMLSREFAKIILQVDEYEEDTMSNFKLKIDIEDDKVNVGKCEMSVESTIDE